MPCKRIILFRPITQMLENHGNLFNPQCVGGAGLCCAYCVPGNDAPCFCDAYKAHDCLGTGRTNRWFHAAWSS